MNYEKPGQSGIQNSFFFAGNRGLNGKFREMRQVWKTELFGMPQSNPFIEDLNRFCAED
jgi:hypothetical protein